MVETHRVQTILVKTTAHLLAVFYDNFFRMFLQNVFQGVLNLLKFSSPLALLTTPIHYRFLVESSEISVREKFQVSVLANKYLVHRTDCDILSWQSTWNVETAVSLKMHFETLFKSPLNVYSWRLGSSRNGSIAGHVNTRISNHQLTALTSCSLSSLTLYLQLIQPVQNASTQKVGHQRYLFWSILMCPTFNGTLNQLY